MIDHMGAKWPTTRRVKWLYFDEEEGR